MDSLEIILKNIRVIRNKFFVILILSAFSLYQVLAYYPSMNLKFENVKIKHKLKEKIEADILEYFEDEPEALHARGKDYKVDQYCKFSLDLNDEGFVDLDTIKLLDGKKNFSYNLAIIDYLRKSKWQFTKKESDEPVELAFKYLSF